MMKFVLYTLIFSAFCWESIATESPWEFNGEVKIKSISSWEDDFDHTLSCQGIFGFLYDTENTWAHTKVKLSMPLEMTNDNRVKLDLDQMMVGFVPLDLSSHKIFTELGRDKLDAMFDSKIQFKNHFNGIHVGYKYSTDFATFRLHGGPNIIDNQDNLYGFIAEATIDDLLIEGSSVKYCAFDWLQSSRYTCQYFISQILYKQKLNPGVLAYMGFLCNHRAREKSKGIYFGCTFEDVIDNLDVDVNYQHVQDLCVPDCDRAGIGTGIQIKATYAVTDNLNFQAKISTTKIAEISTIYKW